ncbi:hypothetical protein TWF569_002086 [Orbilia oligospora]|uniref:YCII-related domain-containing protein n=2 Tax=Orbilia oligospora TaxID=2813651 RepID=A0A7C8TU39_ORBOL|nr:hypothetical protein TWF102_002605 [Orbilia oligospora]KAF3087484.1 hypothetical protein TWF706_011125 [Orbilia oligospora]KAF3095615.1 hypothetical protein TWF103_010082 [Orbilia oligospora]KAF3122683.1 hypothetical protein TWF569_002086 [Orbilia oligospora]KAF3130513.1 hypothetical protein TWF594_010385 [Orbilia oligospora]
MIRYFISKLPRSNITYSTTLRTFSSSRRLTMATEQYFIIVPDHPSAPRLEVRPKHFTKISQESPTSLPRCLFGGAYLSSQPTPETNSTPEKWPFVGSSLALELPAGSGEEAVKEWLKNDPYSTGGVWDWENARIFRFKAGVSNVKELSAGGAAAAPTDSGDGKDQEA